MDTNPNYTLVGAFVILLVSAITISIIWLSSGLSTVNYKYYRVYSQESVSGLNLDAAVEFNGVNVGEVREISIDQTNPHLVRLLLKIKEDTPVTQGTVASVTSKGLTGIAFLALKDEGNDLRPLTVEPGEEYPIIPTSPSIFMRLDSALSSLTKNFETIAHSFNALLDKENLKSFKSILNNLNQFSLSLANNTERLNTIMKNTSAASAQLTPMLKYGNEAMNTLGSQTLPAAYQVLNNLNDVSRSLSEVSIQLKRNPSIFLRGAAPLPPGPGEK